MARTPEERSKIIEHLNGTWQEAVIEAVMDLVVEDNEGTVLITTGDARACRVTVQFQPAAVA